MPHHRQPVTAVGAPAAIGPYSHAVSAAGLLFCSGQIPLDAASGELVGDTPAAQARQCLQNLEAVCEAQETTAKQETEFANLFVGADHWTDLGLGDRWREAGEALGPYPEGARRAYAWSVYFYERYHRSWSDHLPASRWDSDGGGEMMEVHELAQALVANPSEAPLPDWVEALLAGDWQRSLSSFGETAPPAEFKPMLKLLAEACRRARREDAAQRLLDAIGDEA